MYVLNARTWIFTLIQQSEFLSCWLIDLYSVFKILARLSDYSSKYFVSPITSSPLPSNYDQQSRVRKYLSYTISLTDDARLLVWLAMASKCSNCVSETKIATLPPFPHVSYSSPSSLLSAASQTPQPSYSSQSCATPQSHMFHDFAQPAPSVVGAIFSVGVA